MSYLPKYWLADPTPKDGNEARAAHSSVVSAFAVAEPTPTKRSEARSVPSTYDPAATLAGLAHVDRENRAATSPVVTDTTVAGLAHANQSKSGQIIALTCRAATSVAG